MAAIYAGSVADYRVRGTVLMAPHFFTEDMGLAEITKAKAAFDTGDLRKGLAKYHADPDNAFRGWSDTWLHPEFTSWNVADVIDHFRLPTLAIQGADDQYGTVAQIEEIATRAYAPVETLILDDCRHAPFIDQPTEVLNAISEFCGRLMRMEASGLNGA
jgi:pimeloyl-ACP methyl ester carboxylesterase